MSHPIDIDNSKLSFWQWLNRSNGKLYKKLSIVFTILQSIVSFLLINKINLFSEIKILENFSLYQLLIGIHTALIAIVLFFSAKIYVAFKNYKSINSGEKNVYNSLTLVHSIKQANRDKKRQQEKENDNKSPQTILKEIEKEKQKDWIAFKEKTNKVARQFSFAWLLCWIAWLCLYFCFFINTFHDKENPLIKPIFINTINNFSSLMFIFMFMTLTVSTSNKNRTQWFLMAIYILVPLIVLEWITPNSYKDITIWFTIISGLFGSFSMAAFLGALNSRVVSIPIPVFLLLYIYAAIQPFYILLDFHFLKVDSVDKIATSIGFATFVLKIILFLLISWLLQTGRMAHLLIQEGSLFNKGEKYFLELLEHTDLSSFSITDHDGPTDD